LHDDVEGVPPSESLRAHEAGAERVEKDLEGAGMRIEFETFLDLRD
jgi:hypothetical protein